MIDFNDVRIQVRVGLPWSNQIKEYQYEIARLEAEDSLAPLPRNRELDPFLYAESMRQHERRKRLIDLVSKMISNALMNACESEDTDRGYKK